MKVLLLTYMPRSNATARNRVHEYLPYLDQAGIAYTIAPPVPDNLYDWVLHPRGPADRLRQYCLSLYNRLAQLSLAGRHDVVLIQRELFSFGPPVLEYLARRLNEHVVYDFDDAIWGYAAAEAGRVRRFLVDYDKVRKIARLSRSVIAATTYLGEYARRYNPRTFVVPDPIDVDRVLPKTDYQSSSITIGWIGNPFNLPSLGLIAGALRRLSSDTAIRLMVVSSADYRIDGVDVVNKRWRLSEEAEDLRGFDVGVMPLEDTEAARGKGGIKALMCMAAGVPVVCSPVGENLAIVDEGVTGFLASTEAEWVDRLKRLATDEALRASVGRRAREFVVDKYRPGRLAPKFIAALHRAMA